MLVICEFAKDCFNRDKCLHGRRHEKFDICGSTSCFMSKFKKDKKYNKTIGGVIEASCVDAFISLVEDIVEGENGDMQSER